MSNNLLTRLPMLLEQIKAGNNSYKVKTKIRQILYLLYQHHKITEKVTTNQSSHYKNGKKYYCDKRTQNFWFWFYLKFLTSIWSMKLNLWKKGMPNKKTKNKIEQLLSKYKHGNDSCEHRKQHNECSFCLSQTLIKLNFFISQTK